MAEGPDPDHTESTPLEDLAEALERGAYSEAARLLRTLAATHPSGPDPFSVADTDQRALFAGLLRRSFSAAALIERESGLIVEVSDAFCELTGYTRGELVGRTAVELGLVVDGAARGDLTRGSDEDLAGVAQTELRRSDGEIHLIENSTVVLPGNQLAVTMTRDVTERAQSERALRESEERFELLVTAVSDYAVFLLDAEGRVASWNRGAERIKGYTAEEIVGRHFSVFYTADAIERRHPQHELEVALAEGRFEEQGVRVRKDGSHFWAHVTITPVYGESGELRGFAKVTHDVTEQKRSEDALHDSEERFRLLAENSSDMIARVRAEDGCLVYVSQACRQLLGYEPEVLVGTGMIDLVHPDDIGETERHSPRRGDRAALVALELRLRHRDGSYVWTDLRARRVIDPVTGEVTETQVSVRDISERHRLLAELAEARDEAERANRAKSEFLSRMSHELRTPLNAILGFSQLLELDDLSSTQRDGVEHIVKGGRRLLDLINEVLDLTRIETGQLHVSPEPVRVVEIADEAVQLMRPLAARREIRLETCWDVELEAQHVMADRQRLGQVLLNLVSNAVKYNVEWGNVTVSCELAGGEWVRIGVADTGPGVAPDKVPLLFAPFERLGAEQTEIEGTGLGLALSKSLVEAMGGRLLVDTVLGAGSKFWIELPVVEPQAIEERAGAGAPHASTGAGVAGTLLYIEDNLSNLQLIEAILELRPNVELISAMTAGLGVELAREHVPDLILLDLHLPDESGEAVLQRLRKDPRSATVPVVMASADATPGQAKRLLAAGATHYLTKPIEVSVLLAIIDRELGPTAGVGH